MQHQEKIEFHTIEDIQQSFVKYIKDESHWQLSEIIRNSNPKLLHQSEYIYYLDQQLDKMFSRYVYYELYVNDISVITNTYNDSEPL